MRVPDEQIGVTLWFWHAILRRAYQADRAVMGSCPSDWHSYTARDLRSLSRQSTPTVQRWLLVAVHAHDLWLTERTLIDGARANAILLLPDGRRSTLGMASWLMPMTWLLEAQQHGGFMAAWQRATNLPLEEWPDASRFWWTSARPVDDPIPMLHILAQSRRGEDLHHHGYQPDDLTLHAWPGNGPICASSPSGKCPQNRTFPRPVASACERA